MAIMIALLIVGCGSQKTKLYRVCDCEQKDSVATFIERTVGLANNMSDEEMEDVIRQLEATAVRIHCPEQLLEGVETSSGLYPYRIFTPLKDSCSTIMWGIK